MARPDELYVGLMSGTSLDGIDAVLIDLSATPAILAAETFPLPSDLRADLQALCTPGADEIERLGRADRRLGTASAQAVDALLKQAGIEAHRIRAIGSHGQTIRHRPIVAGTPMHGETATAFTLQIGDPATIVELTDITTVADFRRRDIAAGGQGAPLVPTFHRAVFGSGCARAIVNIGGIANVTGLMAGSATLGFDTGPGNTLLDAWIHRHKQQAFDRDGAWAGSGSVLPALLDSLLRDPYFALPAPKSTGREYFHLEWLERQLPSAAPADVQATLLELTARTIADGVATLPFAVDEIFVCGGGAYNGRLMARLEALLHPRALGSTAQLGIAPEWVEAAAFAWLAQQTLRGLPGNDPAATGARGPRILGAIHPR